jgi:hypothetical protein
MAKGDAVIIAVPDTFRMPFSFYSDAGQTSLFDILA